MVIRTCVFARDSAEVVLEQEVPLPVDADEVVGLIERLLDVRDQVQKALDEALAASPAVVRQARSGQ